MTCILDLIPGTEKFFCAEGKIFDGTGNPKPIGDCPRCVKPTRHKGRDWSQMPLELEEKTPVKSMG